MAAWRWEPGDVLVHSLPLYHQHGLSGLHTALIAGSAAHISSAFDAAELIGRSTAARASVLFAVPTIYQALLAQQADAIGPVLGGLRLAVCGSAPLSPELAERLPALLGKLPLVRYGTTESGLNISQPYGDSQPETVGVPLPGTLARIWADGAEAAPGRNGEIQVRGPQVFGGYWRDSAATSAAFTADGWFRTGDIGAIDPSSGHMAIRGRSKEVIITGGLNVYPREVELVLEGHPAIAEAVVAGVPDERWGERVTAWVVRNRGTTLNSDALIAHARSLLAPYKCPKQVIEIAEVPRSGMGKVLRQALPPAPPI
jgi:malonyl-CoA/methylmalonyl-CoA synthetase